MQYKNQLFLGAFVLSGSSHCAEVLTPVFKRLMPHHSKTFNTNRILFVNTMQGEFRDVNLEDAPEHGDFNVAVVSFSEGEAVQMGVPSRNSYIQSHCHGVWAPVYDPEFPLEKDDPMFVCRLLANMNNLSSDAERDRDNYARSVAKKVCSRIDGTYSALLSFVSRKANFCLMHCGQPEPIQIRFVKYRHCTMFVFTNSNEVWEAFDREMHSGMYGEEVFYHRPIFLHDRVITLNPSYVFAKWKRMMSYYHKNGGILYAISSVYKVLEKSAAPLR